MFRHARLLVGKQTGRLKKKKEIISRVISISIVIRDVRKILFLSKEPWYIFTLVNLKLHQLEETLLDEHLGLSVNKLITGNTTEGSRRIEVGESARDKVGELPRATSSCRDLEKFYWYWRVSCWSATIILLPFETFSCIFPAIYTNNTTLWFHRDYYWRAER